MTTINIILAIVAFVLLIGIIAEADPQRARNITIAFVAVTLLIISLNR